jgi:hypoxanthine phosphoribosyltransferase
MSALPWLVPIVISMVVISGYAINHAYVLAVARRLKNVKVFVSPTHQDIWDRVKGAKYINTNRLQGDALQEAIDALAVYVEGIKPDWIVGVHPGGRFLSVLLTEKLGMRREQCLYIATNPARNDHFVFQPQIAAVSNRLEGTMLFVDDIVRTGLTLHHLKLFMKNLNLTGDMHLDAALFATLAVVVPDDDKDRLRFSPDWFFVKTNKEGLKLPWSGIGDRVAHAYLNCSRGLAYDTTLIEFYENITRDFESAADMARKFLSLNQILGLTTASYDEYDDDRIAM